MSWDEIHYFLPECAVLQEMRVFFERTASLLLKHELCYDLDECHLTVTFYFVWLSHLSFFFFESLVIN